MTEADARPTGEAAGPAYLAWKTFMGLTERIENDGIVPSQIDRRYLGNYAGTDQTRILATLKWMDFVQGDKNQVTPLFEEFVKNPDKRPGIIGDIVRRHYPWALALPRNATPQQLLEVFHTETGMDGDTRRKAITFFLNAAGFANIELSPLFRPKAGRPSGGARRRQSSRRAKGGGGGGSEDTPQLPPPPAMADREEMRRDAYLELLKGLVDKADDPDKVASLLDRIEQYVPPVVVRRPHPAKKTPAKGGDVPSGGSNSAGEQKP